jgi:hypothetical protein
MSARTCQGTGGGEVVAKIGPVGDPSVRREVPCHLLALHDKANGTTLDGEGIQAWLEWEMGAMLLGGPWRYPGPTSRIWSRHPRRRWSAWMASLAQKR